jgi:hypothetical protein
MLFQPMLFGLIGAAVNFDNIDLSTLGNDKITKEWASDFCPDKIHNYSFKYNCHTCNVKCITPKSNKQLTFYAPEIEDRGTYHFCLVCHSVLLSSTKNFNLGYNF